MEAQLFTFLVYAPDKTDEGTFQKRLSVRDAHLVTAKERIENGFIRIGGALISPESLASQDKKMVGSVFICKAASIEDVRQKVESDVYWKDGVWDKERVVILPLIPATPIP